MVFQLGFEGWIRDCQNTKEKAEVTAFTKVRARSAVVGVWDLKESGCCNEARQAGPGQEGLLFHKPKDEVV